MHIIEISNQTSSGTLIEKNEEPSCNVAVQLLGDAVANHHRRALNLSAIATSAPGVAAHPKSPTRQWESYGIIIQNGVVKSSNMFEEHFFSYLKPPNTQLSLFLLLDIRDTSNMMIYDDIWFFIAQAWQAWCGQTQVALKLGTVHLGPRVYHMALPLCQTVWVHLLEPASQFILHLGLFHR